MTRRSRSNLDPIGRVQRDLRQLQKEADSPGTKAITTFEEWHIIGAAGQPAFQNGWVNYYPTTPPNETVAFWKDSTGIVRLRGLAKNGTVALDIFTLPIGYRPKGTIRFAVVSAAAFSYTWIGVGGGVNMNQGSNAWVDLCSISFRAEQ